MGKVTKAKIDDLILDDQNANDGTEAGQQLIEQSIATLGLGRSVVVDKNNRLIAGNKTTTGARGQGIEKVVIVDTTGDELVVVRRTDLDLADDDDHRGRALALADNYTAQQNMKWNPDALQIHFDAAMSLDMQEFVFEVPGDKGVKTNKHSDLSGDLEKMYKIEIEFKDEDAQHAAYDELQKLGYECRILTL